jgi:hypothetical protein
VSALTFDVVYEDALRCPRLLDETGLEVAEASIGVPAKQRLEMRQADPMRTEAHEDVGLRAERLAGDHVAISRRVVPAHGVSRDAVRPRSRRDWPVPAPMALAPQPRRPAQQAELQPGTPGSPVACLPRTAIGAVH